MDFKFLLWLLSGYKQISYKHFLAVVAFSLKYSVVPSGETTDRIKKVRGCQNGTDLCYYHHAKYDLDRGSRAPAVDEKVSFFCLFVTLWNYEVCDNGNAVKQCNFQNNSGTIAYRKVSSCAPIFKFLYTPLDFFLGENLYQKLLFWRP